MAYVFSNQNVISSQVDCSARSMNISASLESTLSITSLFKDFMFRSLISSYWISPLEFLVENPSESPTKSKLILRLLDEIALSN
jgi:hypothetical protein